MGKKYSINSAGRIVAERDIYSLGGFIPKGRVGAKIADESQLSQNGECWVAGGDMSTNPWVKVSDNAYIGDYSAGGVTNKTNPAEIKGDTLIPGAFRVYLPATLPTSDLVIKDSFIGVTMDVLLGPEATKTAFPFGQGKYNQNASKGTLFENMVVTPIPTDVCRSFADVRTGKNTYIYTPPGYNCTVLWGYYDVSNKLAYSGEWMGIKQALTKLEHPVYNLCRLVFGKPGGLTPEGLLASGAKILGHVSGSIITEVRGSSEYGAYVMDNSSLKIQTDNFGLVLSPIRTLAGRMINTTCVTEALTQRKVFGTFTNIDYMEYFWDGDTNHRDTVITASDCPLLRVSPNTIKRSLLDTGTLVLRNCIVPAGDFEHDVIDGDTYENIDFSYTREFLSTRVVNRRLICSHRQGLYNMFANGGVMLGRISYPDNTKDATSITEAHDYIPLDGNLIEQGTYYGETVFYENAKHDDTTRVRTKVPLPTRGAAFPVLPSGFGVRAILYLDENFVCKLPVTDPTTLESTYPYFVMAFKRDDLNAKLSASEFIALGQSLRLSDYTKVPEITGSAYIGAGVTVRGDVQLHGDPYVNRVFDVNVWERGTASRSAGDTWDTIKSPTQAGNRFRTLDTTPVEPGGNISCGSGYQIGCYFFKHDGKFLSFQDWTKAVTVPSGASFVGIVVRADSDSLIEDSDIPLASVKYLRAFKRLRYITNELDRTSPEDILLSADYWEQGSMASGEANAGKTYEELKTVYTKAIRLKRPINVFMPGQSTSQGAGFNVSRQLFDALTKLYAPVTDAIQYKTALITLVTVKSDASDVLPSDAPNSRVYIEFTPSPRIIVPYGSATLTVNGVKIRMYDNSVLSRNLDQEGTIILQGSAVMGYDFNSGACLCSNGHDDAIIKLP